MSPENVFPYTIWMMTLVLLFLRNCLAEELLHTSHGSVMAEKYTFYRINTEGRLRVELVSKKGDADLYVTDEDKSAHFDNYKLQATTCGIDSVEIPSSFHRSVGVSVYGYPSAEESKFQLSVYALTKPSELTYDQLTLMLNNYEAIDKLMYGSDNAANQSPNLPKPGSPVGSSEPEEDEDEGSLLWQVFITLLKVVVEILL